MIHIKRIYWALLIIGTLIFTCGCQHTKNTEEVKQETPTIIKKERITYVDFDPTQNLNYASNQSCFFYDKDNSLHYDMDFKRVPRSDDGYIYLFGFEAFEDSSVFDKDPLIKTEKSHHISFQLNYDDCLLFMEYVPAIKYNNSYIALAQSQYPQNPEITAENQEPALIASSKKGLLIDINTLNTPLLDDLNIKHAVYNMPLSFFMVNKDDAASTQTVEFKYQGERYYFKQSSLLAFDTLFTELSEKDIQLTAIILNDWDGSEASNLLIDPSSRKKGKEIFYYQFNTCDKEAVRATEAIALFLTDRYSRKEHGVVQNWIIGNEINQYNNWNYMQTDSIDNYVASYEKSFRIFYNAIKSNNANANVYFSIDHDWNSNGGNDSQFFNGYDIIEKFNTIASTKNNYDWNVAIHPYPVPLTKVNYWSQEYDNSMQAPMLTIMNLNTITSFLQQKEYLNPSGEMRKIAVTELGYTSRTGEMLQAAAFAYGYKIIDANPYIDMFLLNRQTDCIDEMKSGLFLGLYSIDMTPKYLKEVFTNIDSEKQNDYDDLIINIVGAESIEEALSWANP